MARKMRVQFPGALYHVVNRGNYRRDLYAGTGAAQAFLEALAEAVEVNRWRLHAFVLMSNHFHLVLETPEPNLVEGMHWLQSTYSTRFNRFRKERGHLFQGRYHAGLIEDFRVLSHVVDYVHLNPVRAKLVPPEMVECYRWSSLRRLMKGPPMAGLSAEGWFAQTGNEVSAAGWQAYREHLICLANNLEEQKRLGWEGFSYGWALGSSSWKQALAEEHQHKALELGMERAVIRELKLAKWNTALDNALAKEAKTREDLRQERKGVEWKLRLALKLRQEAGASMVWLSETLNLGTQSGARAQVCRWKKIQQSAA